MKEKLCLYILGVLVYSSLHNLNAQTKSEYIDVIKIYSDSAYNSFTSLTKFRNKYYCAFRSSDAHVGGENGKIIIIRSKNLLDWKKVSAISDEKYDLRDPQLSISPFGKILLTLGASHYDGTQRIAIISKVSFSNKRGRRFSKPESIKFLPEIDGDFNWLWRLKWLGPTGYGVVYQINDNKEKLDTTSLKLVKTTDSKSYEVVANFSPNGFPNETTLSFDNERMYAIIRRGMRDRLAYLGRSAHPYNEWDYIPFEFGIGGQNFVTLNDKLFIGTGRVFGKTTVFTFDKNANVIKKFILPSEGDNGYAGMYIDEGELIISYYSSHEGNKHQFIWRKYRWRY